MMLCTQHGHQVSLSGATRLHSDTPQPSPGLCFQLVKPHPPQALPLQVVALANLAPAPGASDELDSYMYQTVGHQLVGAYAQCMALPLFRIHTSGQSSHQVLSLLSS